MSNPDAQPNIMNSATAVAAAVTAGMTIGAQQPVQPAVVEGERSYPVLLVPAGFKAESLKPFIERAFPDRRRAAITLFEVGSFVEYTKAFKQPETQIFADINVPTVVEVLDYHVAGETGAARWAQHKATLNLRLTPEWVKWTAMHGKRVTQREFAEFIEDNLPDIADPDGSLVLRVSRSLHATKNTNFVSDIRLDNGQTQLTFHETVTGTVGGNTVNDTKIAVPDEFTLGLVPYDGASKYAVGARFRYNVSGGKLVMGVDLVRHDRVLRDAFTETVKTIEAGVGGAKVLMGQAPTQAFA